MRHDGLEQVVPAVRAVHVAGTQSTALRSCRTRTAGDSRCERNGRSRRPISCSPWSGSHLNPCQARCHGVAFGRAQDRSAGQTGRQEQRSSWAPRANAPHLTRRSRAPLRRLAALQPQRIAGSWCRRSASFTSCIRQGDQIPTAGTTGPTVSTILATACTEHHPAISIKLSTSSSSR